MTCLPRKNFFWPKVSTRPEVSSGVINNTCVPSFSSVMGHFFPKHQCGGTPRHCLPEPTPPGPGLPVCCSPSAAPGGSPAQRGQAGGGPPGSAVSHQSLPGKAAPAGFYPRGCCQPHGSTATYLAPAKLGACWPPGLGGSNAVCQEEEPGQPYPT